MKNWTTETSEAAQARINALKTKHPTTQELNRDLAQFLEDVEKRTETPHSERTPKTGTTIADKAERNAGAEIAQPQTATQRTQALGRLPKGVMNNTERAYARHLEALKFTGEILDYWFEEIKFKIGTSACWYEPDFLVQVKGGAMEIHECKGHWQDDALVKVKALALRYPFRVIAVRLLKGNWEIREFN